MIADRNESTDTAVRRASFDVAAELITEALEMPANCEIVGVDWSFERHTIRFLPEPPEAPHAPTS